MCELTANQIMAAFSLAESPLIEDVNINVDHDGLTIITITSMNDAEWDGEDGVDMLIARSLDKEFPDLEYTGKSKNYPNYGEIHFLDWNEKVLINLVIEKSLRQEESEA